MTISDEQRKHAAALIAFIDASPSPWHAAEAAENELYQSGFQKLTEGATWSLEPNGAYVVKRGESSLIAFRAGSRPPAETGFRIVGAHTDSPGLRIKPNAQQGNDGVLRIGVEVYGSPILATFSDRDLGIAGRVAVLCNGAITSKLVRFERPQLRLPNLAIHMNRSVNDNGLKFNKQTELPLIWGIRSQLGSSEGTFIESLAVLADCQPTQILSFDLNVYDAQKGSFWGRCDEFVANGQIDNLSSCRAAVSALQDTRSQEHTNVIAFFDHEEIGSESQKGADGSFLGDVLERVAEGLGNKGTEYKLSLAKSLMISADAAHAYNPNFPSAYEPLHAVHVNQGPAVKINVNQRYATDAMTHARIVALANDANIPLQTYVHRSDLACGSTIGPMTAARLGVPTVDIGCPMWAMHSVRESAGTIDQGNLVALLKEFFGRPYLP